MDPFVFEWGVDQDGYTIEHVSPDGLFGFTEAEYGAVGLAKYEAVRPRGGPERSYRALETDGLWRRFADTCKSRDGVLKFASEFGLLRREKETPLNDFLITAHRLSEIAALLDAGDQKSAAVVFHRSDSLLLGGWPLMHAAILPSEKRAGGFEWKLIPNSLRDALLHQAAEAIVGNRRFRRCRNEQCPNWFRIGPPTASEDRRTYTQRREFCSDRCRVAWARRHKREASAHA